MDIVDLAVLHEGRPLVIVEVKSRNIPPHLQSAMLQQIRRYTEASRSEWAILVDPENTLIFRSSDLDQPVASLPTVEILKAAHLSDVQHIGESVLILAIRQWLEMIPTVPELAQRHPEIGDLARSITEGDSVVQEWSV